MLVVGFGSTSLHWKYGAVCKWKMHENTILHVTVGSKHVEQEVFV
jgi:hypothetical protein